VTRLLHDLRYALRTLARNPGFTAVAVLTLAVGIGTNTAVFSVLDSLFYRPLPFPESHRLAAVAKHFSDSPEPQFFIDPPSFLDWTRDSSIFAGAALFTSGSMTVLAGDQSVRIEGSQVSPSTFSVLGVRPRLGRTFLPGEGTLGNNGVVVISDALWRELFDAEPTVLSEQLSIGDASYTIIGVMPAGFAFPHQSELWIPGSFDPQVGRGNNWVNGFVRLRAGVTLAAANAHLAAVSRQLAEQYPQSNKGVSASIAPLQNVLFGGVDPAKLGTIFRIIQAALTMVLLIVCANLTNLLLMRATTRHRELAIRITLGASRARLARQLFTEGALLTAIGGALGVLVAEGSLGLIAGLLRSRFGVPPWLKFMVDWRTLLFVVVVSVLTAVIISVGPVFCVRESELRGALHEAGRTSGPGGRVNRIRAGLIVGEVALATVLLAGAGLLIRTVVGLSNVDTGFDPSHVITMRIPLEGGRYSDPIIRGGFLNELTRRFEAVPGVEAAGAINLLPLGTINGDNAVIEGTGDSTRGVLVSSVTGHYLHALGIPPIEGREFTDAETARGDFVAIINQTMARHYWSQGSALGHRIRFRLDPQGFWRTIVGVSRDITQGQLQNAHQDQVYIPYGRQYSWSTMSWVVRSAGDPTGLAGILRAELKAADPTVPIEDLTSMKSLIRRSFGDRRIYASTLSTLAIIAMLLAAIGIYGVMSYAVVQQTRPIGVRLALGATPRHVLQLVLGQGFRLALGGVVLGFFGAFFASRILRSLLYGVNPIDPVSLIAASAPLMGAAILASLIPARRAMGVDPATALRHE
jgi:putative ABC transport system permease protein